MFLFSYKIRTDHVHLNDTIRRLGTMTILSFSLKFSFCEKYLTTFLIHSRRRNQLLSLLYKIFRSLSFSTLLAHNILLRKGSVLFGIADQRHILQVQIHFSFALFLLANPAFLFLADTVCCLEQNVRNHYSRITSPRSDKREIEGESTIYFENMNSLVQIDILIVKF